MDRCCIFRRSLQQIVDTASALLRSAQSRSRSQSESKQSSKNHPDGWGAKGYSEWGAFKLGKTNPNISTTGLAATVGAFVAATGTSSDLTLDALKDTRVRDFVAGVEEGARRQHRGREVRGAQQSAAHLLEHHGELDEREALATELLGDDEALQAHLLTHLAPDGFVVALLGVHEPAYLGFGRLLVEERPHGAA